MIREFLLFYISGHILNEADHSICESQIHQRFFKVVDVPNGILEPLNNSYIIASQSISLGRMTMFYHHTFVYFLILTTSFKAKYKENKAED